MVNKKGTKRKTRWRTLSITDGGPTGVANTGAETQLTETTGATNYQNHHHQHYEGNLCFFLIRYFF